MLSPPTTTITPTNSRIPTRVPGPLAVVSTAPPDDVVVVGAVTSVTMVTTVGDPAVVAVDVSAATGVQITGVTNTGVTTGVGSAVAMGDGAPGASVGTGRPGPRTASSGSLADAGRDTPAIGTSSPNCRLA